jgi:hypothetical protein
LQRGAGKQHAGIRRFFIFDSLQSLNCRSNFILMIGSPDELKRPASSEAGSIQRNWIGRKN